MKIDTDKQSKTINTPIDGYLAVMPSCLRLPLMTKWFEMTKSGIKKEDYREINPYWYNRLFEGGHRSKLLRQEACDNFINENSATNWNFKNPL